MLALFLNTHVHHYRRTSVHLHTHYGPMLWLIRVSIHTSPRFIIIIIIIIAAPTFRTHTRRHKAHACTLITAPLLITPRPRGPPNRRVSHSRMPIPPPPWHLAPQDTPYPTRPASRLRLASARGLYPTPPPSVQPPRSLFGGSSQAYAYACFVCSRAAPPPTSHPTHHTDTHSAPRHPVPSLLTRVCATRRTAPTVPALHTIHTTPRGVAA
jgi:hypothetical protein